MLKEVAARIYAWKYWLLILMLLFSLWNLTQISRQKAELVGLAHLDSSKLTEFFAYFYRRHEKLHQIQTRSRNYDEIFSEINMYDFLAKHALHDRCMIYFNHLSMSDPDWLVDPHRGLVFNRDAYKNYNEYRQGVLRDAERKKEQAKKKGKAYDMPTDTQIRVKYDDLRRAVLNDEQTLHDYIAHMRVFEKCFMGLPGPTKADVSFVKKQRTFLKKSVVYLKGKADQVSGRLHKDEFDRDTVNSKLFPWLTGEYPVFTRWNGKTASFPGYGGRMTSRLDYFLKEYWARLNGRGIVMTLNDDHVNDATRFLHVLRFMKNKLPVQVVYHSDLSEAARANLVRAARDYFRGFSEQDLWFVDAQRAIDKKYRNKFMRFSNKIVATMFNSFQEMLLCDADSVLLVSPTCFFELKKFVATGTIFYKDRASGQYRGLDDLVFFKKLLPSVEDSVVFNVPQATNFTLNNEFFNGFSHYMESGVVAIDRKRHFMQPMVMSLLSFYSPTMARVYGDKELFWLALSLAGDEKYAFNSHFAAAIGEFTPEVERHKDTKIIKSFRSKEICSNHPAHISDADGRTLMWFNSGFRHCGNSLKTVMNWDNEFNLKKRYTRLKTLEEFKTFFRAPLEIKNAIIPPFTLQQYLLKNVEHEPEVPWAMPGYCNNYCWCAYSLIGGYYTEDGETSDNMIEGKIITFTAEERKHFQKVSDIWITDFEWQT